MIKIVKTEANPVEVCLFLEHQLTSQYVTLFWVPFWTSWLGLSLWP